MNNDVLPDPLLPVFNKDVTNAHDVDIVAILATGFCEASLHLVPCEEIIRLYEILQKILTLID